MSPLPELFGSYVLHHRLLGGATSDIYLAQTTGDFPRLCAIKRVRPELATLPDFPERFRTDAKLLVRLLHGNLVQVLEVGTVEGQPFLATELIDGVDLNTLIESATTHGALPPEVVLYIGIELCEALAYLALRRREHYGASEVSFEHAWSLKVMLSFDGVVKVVGLGSFGALRLGKRKIGDVLDRPGYSVPEIVKREPVGTAADIFAVGVILWELLSGKRLLADEPEAYVREVLTGSWQAPALTRHDVPTDTLRLIAGMLQAQPEQRIGSLEQVRTTLVGGLRRLSPTFGSSNLAQLLFRRFPELVGNTEELTDHLVRHAMTVQPQPAGAPTLTLGWAGAVDRRISPIALLRPGDPIPGTRYRVVRPLGRGGGAEVFAAQHIDLDRQAAIKILSPELATQAEAIAQFRLEARTCSRLGHPNIVDVIDFGELDDGRFFFAMELLRGETLGDLLAHEQCVAPARAIGIFRQISKALQAAHEHGVIHRDLKPENIMLTEKDGRQDFVKVLDFGVMAFAEDERADRVGTPGYMAPEQLARQKPTARTDVYAMGAVLYEALCGQLPYAGETLDEYAAQQNAGPPPALRRQPGAADVPTSLELVAHRALERDPQARHPSAADFEADLIRAQRQAGLTTQWDDLPWPEHLRDRRASAGVDTAVQRRGRPLAWIGLAAVLMALVGLATTVIWRQTHAPSDGMAVADPSRSIAQDKLPVVPPRHTEPMPSADAAPSSQSTRVENDRQENARTVRNATADGHAKRAEPTTRARLSNAVARRASGKPSRAPREASTSEPSADTKARAARLVREGSTLLAQLQLNEARQRFREAIELSPNNAAAFAGLAAVAFQQAKYIDAVELARRALAANPRSLAANLVLGDALLKLERRDEARRTWKRVLRIDPQNKVASVRLARIDGTTP